VNPLLGDQQWAFLQTLTGADSVPPGLVGLRGVALNRGLQAYQGHARSQAARTLGQTFPKLAAHLGEADFSALAWTFWREHPPGSGDLGEWGDALEAFLLQRAGAASGLPGLARLEWALHQAERSDDASLDAESLQCLATEPPDAVTLRLRPGLQLLSLETEAFELLGLRGVGARPVMVWRQAWRGEWTVLSLPQARFVGAVLAGASLQLALEAAAQDPLCPDEAFDFSAWLQDALRRDWLWRAGRSGAPAEA
jgi:hypothetical protein